MERIDHLLPWSTLGSEKRLSVFRFGCGARKVYIQSSLHADELPGMRTAWELKQRLRLLEAEGRLRGTVELVPVANPVGLGQMIQALHQGRFEMSSGRNFNRDFPDLLDAVIDSVGERLGSDPAANVALVRQTLRAALDALPPATSELEGMQRLLYRHACDADLVLDLHCDFEAAIHLYTLPQQWPAFASLAARLGAAVGLLAEESGGGSFDEPARCRGCACRACIRAPSCRWPAWRPPSNSAARPTPPCSRPRPTPRRSWPSSPSRASSRANGRRRPKPAAKACPSRAPNTSTPRIPAW